MTQSDPTGPEPESLAESGRAQHLRSRGYYLRETADFHREANVLDGVDPQRAAPLPPKNIKLRRWLVFIGAVVMALAAVGFAIWMISLPDCQNPPNNFMPCFG